MTGYSTYQGYGSAPNQSSGGGNAQYPGLGGPIGAYGQGPGGMSMGPYSFLGQAGGSSGGGNGIPLAANSAATGFLNGVLSGSNLPYSQTQQTAMLGQSSAMNAAAERMQNQQAQAASVQGGASPNDPSLKSSMANNAALRQNENQNAQGDIMAKAGSANFDAQSQAAGGLMHSGEAEQALGLQQEGLQDRQSQFAQSQLMGMMGGRGSMGGMGGYQGQQGLSNSPNGFAGFGAESQGQYSGYRDPALWQNSG